MGSGRPARPAEPRGGGSLPGRIVLSGLVLALGLSLGACASHEAAFAAARRGIDEALKAAPGSTRDAGLGAAYAKAMRLARSSGEWLSLLKRAKAGAELGDRGRYRTMAETALKKGPPSPDLALAAADAFLAAGVPAAVLELFSTRLSLEDHGQLWAEAVIEALRLSTLPDYLQVPATYARLARLTGKGRFYLDAASRSLASGDPLGARNYLAKADAAQVAIPAALAWDAGLYGELAARERVAGAADLRLMGDAHWMLGQRSQAQALWTKAVAADPAGSFRTYASLAAASGEGLSPGDYGLFDLSGNLGLGEDGEAPLESATTPGSLMGRAARAPSHRAVKPPFHDYFGRLKAAFPHDPGALVVYAGALAREGREEEAVKALAASETSTEARILADRLRVGGVLWSGDRLATEAVKAVALQPRDPSLVDAALLILLSRGAYADFLVLFDGATARGVEAPRLALYRAYASLLRGRFEEAQGALAQAALGPDAAAGPEVEEAQAVLAERVGDRSLAAGYLERALAKARGAKEACAMLKFKAALAEASGDYQAAHLAYVQASLADPSDTEARRLSQR